MRHKGNNNNLFLYIDDINNIINYLLFNLNKFFKKNVLIKLFLFFIYFVIFTLKLKKNLKVNIIELNKKYKNIQIKLNLSFQNIIKNKIKLAIYEESLKNGGRERMTSLMLNYLNKAKFFDLYLFTKQTKEDNEYKIPSDIKRIILKNYKLKGLVREIKKKK